MIKAQIKIAITGPMRAGKDAAVRQLTLKHGFQRYAFGDMLKHFAHQVFPFVAPASKPRALLQEFGQAMRNMPVDGAEDIWIWWLEHAMTIDGFDRVVISDLRQPNEYEWARANGFTVVRVTAPEATRKARAALAGDTFSEADMAHETEQHVAGFAADYEIANDGTLVELQAKIDALMAELVR